MRNEDYVPALVARRLVSEATVPELQELDELLKKISGTDRRIKVIAGWWRGHIQQEMARRGALIFEGIKEKIKAREDQ